MRKLITAHSFDGDNRRAAILRHEQECSVHVAVVVYFSKLGLSEVEAFKSALGAIRTESSICAIKALVWTTFLGQRTKFQISHSSYSP